MQSNNMDKLTETDSQMTAEQRKLRVKRMKIAILVTIAILFLIPTLLCIILGIRVIQLENQVENLNNIHKSNLTSSAIEKESYRGAVAYAAEKSDGSTESPNNSGRNDKPTDSHHSDKLVEYENKPNTTDTKDYADDDRTDILDGNIAENNIADGNISDRTMASGNIAYGNITDSYTVNGNSTDTGTDEARSNEASTNNTNASDTKSNEAKTSDTKSNEAKTSDIKTGNVKKANDNKTEVSPTDDKTVDKDKIIDKDKIVNKNKSDVNPTDNSTTDKADLKTVDKNGIYAGKKVYLTFDDGPSSYTDDILDILAYYDSRATFFVVGKTDEESIQLYRRIIEEGHTLGMHSYSHKYNEIYNSLEDFDKDFTKLWNLLYDTTGYIPTIYRFPGGSLNQVNKKGMNDFIKYLDEKSMLYYDWNVDNGDATGVAYTKDQLINNVLNGVANKKRSIVLMHDVHTKKTTVDSLPELLEALIYGGAEVLPLNVDVKPIQQIKADEVK